MKEFLKTFAGMLAVTTSVGILFGGAICLGYYVNFIAGGIYFIIVYALILAAADRFAEYF